MQPGQAFGTDQRLSMLSAQAMPWIPCAQTPAAIPQSNTLRNFQVGYAQATPLSSTAT